MTYIEEIKRQKPMKFLDLFSGIGGFRLGLEMAGHECVGHIEIDKFANQSYRAIHQPKESEFFHEDITNITDESIRELRERGIDIITGGFPCQAFSIAGERRGFEDTRGTLFFDIAKIAKEIKPKYLFLENVKGLLNHDRGDTFEVILRTLDEIGYDAEWSCLNSKDFGVPQNRERVFIIGHLRSERTRKVFPIGESNGTADELQGQHVGTITTRTGEASAVGTYIVEGEQFSQEIKVAGYLPGTNFNQNKTVYEIDGIAPTLRTPTGGGNESAKIAVPVVFEQRTDEGVRLFNDGVCGTIRATDSGGDKRVYIPVLTPSRVEKRQNGRRFKEDGEPMFTLTAQDRHGVAIMRPKRTEYGKAIRKDYESGKVVESRHNMTKLEPVFDGLSNTITTVQKDNLLLDQRHGVMVNEQEVELKKIGNIYPSKGQNGNIYDSSGLSPTLSSGVTDTKGNGGIGSNNAPKIFNDFRIRKLTPKECWRLQGFPDWAFERAKAAGVSDSQLYKQAGNSVTVNVVYEIAKRLK